LSELTVNKDDHQTTQNTVVLTELAFVSVYLDDLHRTHRSP